MLKTPFPYDPIDYEAYFDAYLGREDAVKTLPDREELRALARKNIVKGHITLEEIPADEAVASGDTVSFSCESTLPKYNKEKITVSIGRGLFNRPLEDALIGAKKDEVLETSADGEPVRVRILSIRRKLVPEPTDEMAAEMGVKDMRQQPVTTVAGYEEMIYEQKRMEVLGAVNYYVTEPIFRDHPVMDCAAEDLSALADLEERMFYEMFLRDEGIDLYKESKEAMQARWGCDSFRDFIALRYDWYKIKVQQCLVYANILGIPLTGEMDPTKRYEVLSELTLKMYDRAEEAMKKRSKE